jgi:hypothetical protein
MISRPLILAIAFMALFLCAAGCTQTPSGPPATTVPTSIPATTVPATTAATATATTASTSAVSTPGPIQTIPEIYNVDVQVNSNGMSIDPKVIATFRGGKGINFVYNIVITLYRGDGKVETATMSQPLSVGQTVELPSTTGNTDRVVVVVTLQNGNSYTIVDQTVPFRQYH